MPDLGSVAKLRFRLFGSAAVEGSGPAQPRISSRKGMALLAYLAMHRGQRIPRATIADLLWGSRGETGARQNLRQALLTVRRDLGAVYSSILEIHEQSISLAPNGIEVDALQFEELARSSDSDIRTQCLDIAWAPFLADLQVDAEGFDDWVASERHRLNAQATRTFADLATHFESVGDGERAIAAVERLIALDPGEEGWHRRLLRLEARFRGVASALGRARELAALLRRELDAPPESATTLLVEEIRRKGGVPLSAEVVLLPRALANGGEETASLSETPHGNVLAPPEPQARSRSRVIFIAAAAAVVAMLAGAASALWTARGPVEPSQSARTNGSPSSSSEWNSPSSPSHTGQPSPAGRGIIPIAVAPLKTYDDSSSTRLYAEMMTDDITNMLSRIRYFRVISQQTIRHYQQKQVDVLSMAADLNVRYVLDGSFRLHDGVVRVSVELIDTASRSVVWSTRIDRAEGERHDVRDEIVMRLARELQIGSYRVEGERQSSSADADVLAFKGMAALQAAYANINLEAYRKAEALFLQALERDPAHILARLGVGSYHLSIGVQRLVPDWSAQVAKSIEILTDVVERAPNISGAHHQLGVALQGFAKLEPAAKAFERAIEINPSNAGAYAHLGFVMARLRRLQEGSDNLRYAMRLSPQDPSLSIWLEFAGTVELERENLKGATEFYERSRSLSPGYPRAWAGLAAAQALAGDMEAAQASLDRLRTLAPGLTAKQAFERFGRRVFQLPQLQKGLRLALAIPEQ